MISPPRIQMLPKVIKIKGQKIYSTRNSVDGQPVQHLKTMGDLSPRYQFKDTQTSSRTYEMKSPKHQSHATEYMKKFQRRESDSNIDVSQLRSYRDQLFQSKGLIFDDQTTNKQFFQAHPQQQQYNHILNTKTSFPMVYKTTTYNSTFFNCPTSLMGVLKEEPRAAVLPFKSQNGTTYSNSFNDQHLQQQLVQLIRRESNLRLGPVHTKFDEKKRWENPQTGFQLDVGEKQLDQLMAGSTPIYKNQYQSQVMKNYQTKKVPFNECIRHESKIKIFLG